MRDREIALLEPNAEIIECSVCDKLIWQHRAEPITARMSVSSRASNQTTAQAFQLMKQAADELYQEMVAAAEEACRAHMQNHHRFRLWLWDRYGWDRVLKRWFW